MKSVEKQVWVEISGGQFEMFKLEMSPSRAVGQCYIMNISSFCPGTELQNF